MIRCKACGEVFGADKDERKLHGLARIASHGYCFECAAELFDGKIVAPTYKQPPPYVRHGHVPSDSGARNSSSRMFRVECLF